MRSLRIPVAAFSLLLPSLAYADLVWPALYLETRLFAWWAIGFGLLVEFFFVRRLFHVSRGRSALATLAANAVSAAAGIVLVPLSGMAWEFVAMWSYQRWFGWGTFNPLTWLVTLLLAASINTLLEGAVYRYVFRFAVHRRELLWLLLANALTVAMAFGSLWLAPIAQY